MTDIDIERGIGLVTAIGNSVKEKGIDSISKIIISNNIKINTIVKSANSKNLCLIVDEKDIKRSVRLLHNIFIELEVKK